MKSQTKAKILCFMAFVSNGFTMFHDVLAGDLNSEFFRFIILSRLENLDFYIILPITGERRFILLTSVNM